MHDDLYVKKKCMKRSFGSALAMSAKNTNAYCLAAKFISSCFRADYLKSDCGRGKSMPNWPDLQSIAVWMAEETTCSILVGGRPNMF